ncbi:MAG: hypothetical protein QNJ44_22630 [Rhodobacter sp.]|nr:hypothetical protein [Rhodobacter sp.]
MTPMCQDSLSHALRGFTALPGPKARFDWLRRAAIETGGDVHLPEDSNWDTQVLSVKAHGIFAEGNGVEDLVHAWHKNAMRQVGRLGELAAARHLICHGHGPIADRQMREACEVILTDSLEPSLRLAAREILRVLDAADRKTAA